MKNSFQKASLRVVLPYVVLAALWMLFADRLLDALVTNATIRNLLAPADGWAFIVVTGLLLVFLLRAELHRRERDQAALRVSEAAWQTIINTSPDGIGILSAEGLIEFASDHLLAMFGYASLDKIKGVSMLQFMDAANHKKAGAHLHATLSGQLPVPEEYLAMRQDGSRFTVEVNTQALPNEAGQPRRILLVARDISGRKPAEAALLESARFASSTLDSLSEHIAILDQIGTILTVNRAWREFAAANHPTGAQPVVEGVNYLAACDAAQGAMGGMAATFATGIRHVLAGQAAEFVLEYACHAPTEQRWFVGRVTRFAGVGPVRAVMAHENVTAQKIAAEANRQLAVAMDQIGESIVFTDVCGIIRYVNQRFEKTTGYTRQEVVGQNPRILKSGKQPPEFYQAMWEQLTRGEVWKGCFSNRRKDGKLFEEEATISPVYDTEGNLSSYVAVKRDITRELQLERQFIEAQKLDAVGQLAGGVAHDYNNILAASIMQLGMLLSDPALSLEMREGLVTLKKGADRATALTRQLLLFSRRQAMENRPVELNALLEDELKMLRRLLGEHIDLVLQASSGDTWIDGDPGMIEQVILNLCINARDAMPQGGQLTVSIRPVELKAADLATRLEARPGKYACLSVTDAGCGMSEETLSRIFEPFFTTKEVGKGTGLGLATVYGIVKQHQGWLEVRSKTGQGSSFQVFLPARPTAQKPAASVSSIPKFASSSGTILVVEDEAPLRMLLAKSLTFAGYHIIEAATGEEGLQQWHRHADQIQLLLTDMIMPGGMTGLELAETLLQLKPNLPVIVTSGYNNQVVQSGIPSRAGLTYLPKPWDFSVLIAAIHQALENNKLDRR